MDNSGVSGVNRHDNARSHNKRGEKNRKNLSQDSVLKNNHSLAQRSNLVDKLVKADKSDFSKKSDRVSLSEAYSKSNQGRVMNLLFNQSRQELSEAVDIDKTEDTAAEKEIQDLDEIIPEYANSENTANRITDFATSLLPHYLDNHGGELTKENLEGFMNLISDAIDTGFEQARGIISDEWEAMDDPLSALISKTYSKVQENLATFEEMMLAQIEVNNESTDSDVIRPDQPPVPAETPTPVNRDDQ